MPAKLGPDDLRDLAAADRSVRIRLARHYAAKKQILQWGRCLFPQKFSLPFCPLHEYLVDVRLEEFTNTEAPRNHAKTTDQCFLIPIFQALEEPDNFNHYLNVQSTNPKALSINVSIRHEIETNDELREIYGEMIGNEKWTDGQFVLSNGTVFTAISAGQSIRGINYNNRRPDYIIVDDLYETEDINNPDSTKKKTDWFWSDLYPCRAQDKQSSVHVQGTAINNVDILEQLKSSPAARSRSFRTVIDWEKKIVLWPELKKFEEWMREKDELHIPSVIWFREYQNERRDEESSIIKSDWLKDWEFDPDELELGDHLLIEELVLSCDPSIGKNPGSDFTGCALTLKTRYDDGEGNDWWIIGLWNEKLSLDKRVILLNEIGSGRYFGRKVDRVVIEGIGGFKDFVEEVRRRTNLPVSEVARVPDKITNLENKSHYFENGKVHVSKRIDPKLRDLIKHQLTTNYPPHDDVRDGLLLALEVDSESDVKVTVV